MDLPDKIQRGLISPEETWAKLKLKIFHPSHLKGLDFVDQYLKDAIDEEEKWTMIAHAMAIIKKHYLKGDNSTKNR